MPVPQPQKNIFWATVSLLFLCLTFLLVLLNLSAAGTGTQKAIARTQKPVTHPHHVKVATKKINPPPKPEKEQVPAKAKTAATKPESVATTTDPGEYILVTTALPQMLRLYVNGSVVLATYCNTGIAQAPTPYGRFYVYLKLRACNMSGVDPFGNHYFDPDVPYVMYFYRSCAIHGFIRKSYGFPQSLGCVELPPAEAEKLFQLVDTGTVVIIKKTG